MTNHTETGHRHPDLKIGDTCLYCHSHLNGWDYEVTSRVVGAFLTTDLVAQIEATLVENWTGDQIDAAPAMFADRLHPACLAHVMAAAV